MTKICEQKRVNKTCLKNYLELEIPFSLDQFFYTHSINEHLLFRKLFFDMRVLSEFHITSDGGKSFSQGFDEWCV